MKKGAASNRVTSNDWIGEYRPQYDPNIDLHSVFDRVLDTVFEGPVASRDGTTSPDGTTASAETARNPAGLRRFSPAVSRVPSSGRVHSTKANASTAGLIASWKAEKARSSANNPSGRIPSSNRVSTADFIANEISQDTLRGASERVTSAEYIKTYVLDDTRKPDSQTTPTATTETNSSEDEEERPSPDSQCECAACEPKDCDVLFGRGGRGNHHPGNKRYRDMVKQIQPKYKVCTKVRKTELSRSIVDYVLEHGGRFLVQDEITKKWHEADKKDARRKVSQALREEPRAARVAKRKPKS